ncbi:glycoside hydrolase family 2 [Blautia liquoris]|uniref:Glycoside hydrolase family 2 n=1 Tax=Blautia liquoris TaxID=2779518 RepID=A0A7M2RLM1_9FIRM|nr:sugar-binding domain-containing protein [Blautia liquoris]QOV20252.1 glycoside hydrolase family 2 [Blautia liquoris]
MGQDFFQSIAMTKHPDKHKDREVPAPLLREVQLEEVSRPKFHVPWQKDPSWEEQQEQFKQDLDRLRIWSKPFLKNYLPKMNLQIKTIQLEDFEFRYLEQNEVFMNQNDPEKKWTHVRIPDYKGPAEEDGNWEAYYKYEFSLALLNQEIQSCQEKDRVVLRFQCVDYIAKVYLNGNYIGSHEGIFAPFSFDITKYLEEDNELIVLCKNEIPILGTGPVLDGDKIYAATGPGWDDSDLGWHHCPAGAGIFGKVELQVRPEIYVDDIFVRPEIDLDYVELRIGVHNYTLEVKEDYEFCIRLMPRNYVGKQIGELTAHISYIGPGKNEYRYRIPVKDYRLWCPDEPWLYGAFIEVKKDEHAISERIRNFGMKKFVSDESCTPKGKFYLNNRPIVLRGANEMGNLQQCAMSGNISQLIDDILIAKLCHMNFYRITQRPVQDEIYDYFDMLGMMNQCDFPLFGFLRRPQVSEALKQVGEMEHLVRGHVSTCMVTFINEPMCIRRTENPEDKFSKRYEMKGHRHLQRDELEAFFQAARKVIYIENPDRVVKNAEGDYDGPTLEGMPDFHCYTMWYTNHGEPIGKLMRGYLPPVKEGWMTGCGEYGAEGLDNEDVMNKRYPKEWLKDSVDGNWYPDKIVKSQTYLVHGDWYKEQQNVHDWIVKSQEHQAKATRLMTDAFRRRADIINQTAIHLLIDAWPAGWMKALVDCERNPKRAYFAYQKALIPLRINLYTGRNHVYDDEVVDIEAWLLNDTAENRNLTIIAEIFEEGEDRPYQTFEKAAEADAANACYAGKINVRFQQRKEQNRTVIIKAGIFDENYILLNQETLNLQIYRRQSTEIESYVYGRAAQDLADKLVYTKKKKIIGETLDVWMLSKFDSDILAKFENYIKSGGRGILLMTEDTPAFQLFEYQVSTRPGTEVFFAAALDVYEKYSIEMVYNNKKGYVDATASCTIETTIPGRDIVYTYDKKPTESQLGPKPRKPIVKICRIGMGTVILVTLCCNGRIGYNPGLDQLMIKLIEGEIV